MIREKARQALQEQANQAANDLKVSHAMQDKRDTLYRLLGIVVVAGILTALYFTLR